MTTKTKKIMPLLIISLLTLSIATLTSIQAASASNAGLIFTPNYLSVIFMPLPLLLDLCF